MTEETAALDDNMPPDDVQPEVEATEPVAEAITEESAPSPVEDSNEEPKENKVQARINKITADKYEAIRRAEEAERKLEAAQVAHEPKAAGEPSLEDFDYDEQAFNAALIEYKVEQKAVELQERQVKAEQEKREREVAGTYNAKVAKFSETATDFIEVVSKMPILPVEAEKAIMQSENGPELAYYLAKHLDVADDIATSSPIMAAMKLGQISAQLSATTKPESKLSAAPEPIEPVTNSGGLSKDVEDMSMEEIMAL